ncbi:MAG: hypothetical protein ABWZ16_06615, partial [Microbacterium sp.]
MTMSSKRASLSDELVAYFSGGGPDDPAELYSRVFDNGPVLWLPLDGGCWVVASHKLATTVLADSEHFTRGGAAEVN